MDLIALLYRQSINGSTGGVKQQRDSAEGVLGGWLDNALWLAVAGVGTVTFAMAPNYPVALLGRGLGGAGVGIVLVCAFGTIGRWFGPRHFGVVIGLYVATGPLGGLLATQPLAALVDLVGWRAAFGLIAIWSFATALGVVWVIPDYPNPARASSFRAAWGGLVRAAELRNVWLAGIYTFVALGILSSMQGLWETGPRDRRLIVLDRPSPGECIPPAIHRHSRRRGQTRVGVG